MNSSFDGNISKSLYIPYFRRRIAFLDTGQPQAAAQRWWKSDARACAGIAAAPAGYRIGRTAVRARPAREYAKTIRAHNRSARAITPARSAAPAPPAYFW